MKLKALSFTLLAAAMTMCLSCTDDAFVNRVDDDIHSVVALLPAFLDEDTGTRTELTINDDDVIQFRWSVGDMLGIFPDEGLQTYFRLDEGSLSADGKSATFDGGGWALKNGRSYYAYYPFSEYNCSMEASPSWINLDYMGQWMSDWDDLESVAQHDYNGATAAQANGGALSFAFQRFGALLRLRVKLPETAVYTGLMLAVQDDEHVLPLYGTVDLTAETLAFEGMEMCSELNVELWSLEGTKGEEAFIYLMMPPVQLRANNLTLTATLYYGEDESKTYNLCKTGQTEPHTPNFLSNTIYKRDLVPTEPEEDPADAYEYVDLDLPSGLLWASYNVGATYPEERGDYFAWGETVGYHNDEDKDHFQWKNNAHVSYNAATNKSTWLKYCSGDGKLVLDPEDDAATQNWGSPWRMPTKADWDELFKNSDRYMTTQNDVRGILLTSKRNGEEIFLPFTGYMDSNGIVGVDLEVRYWSSQLDTENRFPNNAFCFYAQKSDYVKSFNYYTNKDALRITGMCVRPVRQGPKLVASTTNIRLCSDGETADITLTGEASWTASITEGSDWLTLSQTSGTGSTTFSVTAASNTGSGREGVINIMPSNEQEPFTIFVKQDRFYPSVDLGLPSGKKWATFNYGAQYSYEFGDFMAWGETSGYNSGKTLFSWPDYKYYNINNESTPTQYLEPGVALLPADDVIAQNWGGSWHIPTVEEWKELIENTTIESASIAGVFGFKFIAGNGQYIFLPAAGLYSGPDRIHTYYCHYWTSNLQETVEELFYQFADSFLFALNDEESIAVDLIASRRCLGLSLRAVRN